MRGYLGGIILGGIAGALGLSLLSLSAPLPKAANHPEAPVNLVPAPEGLVQGGTTRIYGDGSGVLPKLVSEERLAELEAARKALEDMGSVAAPRPVEAPSGLTPLEPPQADLPSQSVEAPFVVPSQPRAEEPLDVMPEAPPVVPSPPEALPPQTGLLPEPKGGKPLAPFKDYVVVVVEEPVVAPPKPTPSAEKVEPVVEPAAAIVPEAVVVPERNDIPQILPADAPKPSSSTVVELEPAVVPPETAVLKSVTPEPAVLKPEPVASAPAAVVPEPLPQAALVRNARPFVNRTGNPPFAILLIDDPQSGVDLGSVAGGDLPLTLIIDANAEGAATRAALWRAAGQEVALLATALPKSTEPADMEIALEALTASFPQALALVDSPEAGLQGDRARASALMQALGARGFGLVTWEEGLRMADQIARREGLPSATIYREIDGKDEAAAVIRRYLDRAAFKAQQEGQAVVIGHLRPETLRGINEWSVEEKAAGLSLAPLSALVKAD